MPSLLLRTIEWKRTEVKLANEVEELEPSLQLLVSAQVGSRLQPAETSHRVPSQVWEKLWMAQYAGSFQL